MEYMEVYNMGFVIGKKKTKEVFEAQQIFCLSTAAQAQELIEKDKDFVKDRMSMLDHWSELDDDNKKGIIAMLVMGEQVMDFLERKDELEKEFDGVIDAIAKQLGMSVDEGDGDEPMNEGAYVKSTTVPEDIRHLYG